MPTYHRHYQEENIQLIEKDTTENSTELTKEIKMTENTQETWEYRVLSKPRNCMGLLKYDLSERKWKISTFLNENYFEDILYEINPIHTVDFNNKTIILYDNVQSNEDGIKLKLDDIFTHKNPKIIAEPDININTIKEGIIEIEDENEINHDKYYPYYIEDNELYYKPYNPDEDTTHLCPYKATITNYENRTCTFRKENINYFTHNDILTQITPDTLNDLSKEESLIIHTKYTTEYNESESNITTEINPELTIANEDEIGTIYDPYNEESKLPEYIEVTDNEVNNEEIEVEDTDEKSNIITVKHTFNDPYLIIDLNELGIAEMLNVEGVCKIMIKTKEDPTDIFTSSLIIDSAIHYTSQVIYSPNLQRYVAEFCYEDNIIHTLLDLTDYYEETRNRNATILEETIVYLDINYEKDCTHNCSIQSTKLNYNYPHNQWVLEKVDDETVWKDIQEIFTITDTNTTEIPIANNNIIYQENSFYLEQFLPYEKIGKYGYVIQQKNINKPIVGAVMFLLNDKLQLQSTQSTFNLQEEYDESNQQLKYYLPIISQEYNETQYQLVYEDNNYYLRKVRITDLPRPDIIIEYYEDQDIKRAWTEENQEIATIIITDNDNNNTKIQATSINRIRYNPPRPFEDYMINAQMSNPYFYGELILRQVTPLNITLNSTDYSIIITNYEDQFKTEPLNIVYDESIEKYVSQVQTENGETITWIIAKYIGDKYQYWINIPTTQYTPHYIECDIITYEEYTETEEFQIKFNPDENPYEIQLSNDTNSLLYLENTPCIYSNDELTKVIKFPIISLPSEVDIYGIIFPVEFIYYPQEQQWYVLLKTKQRTTMLPIKQITYKNNIPYAITDITIDPTKTTLRSTVNLTGEYQTTNEYKKITQATINEKLTTNTDPTGENINTFIIENEIHTNTNTIENEFNYQIIIEREPPNVLTEYTAQTYDKIVLNMNYYQEEDETATTATIETYTNNYNIVGYDEVDFPVINRKSSIIVGISETALNISYTTIDGEEITYTYRTLYGKYNVTLNYDTIDNENNYLAIYSIEKITELLMDKPIADVSLEESDIPILDNGKYIYQIQDYNISESQGVLEIPDIMVRFAENGVILYAEVKDTTYADTHWWNKGFRKEKIDGIIEGTIRMDFDLEGLHFKLIPENMQDEEVEIILLDEYQELNTFEEIEEPNLIEETYNLTNYYGFYEEFENITRDENISISSSIGEWWNFLLNLVVTEDSSYYPNKRIPSITKVNDVISHEVGRYYFNVFRMYPINSLMSDKSIDLNIDTLATSLHMGLVHLVDDMNPSYTIQNTVNATKFTPDILNDESMWSTGQHTISYKVDHNGMWTVYYDNILTKIEPFRLEDDIEYYLCIYGVRAADTILESIILTENVGE